VALSAESTDNWKICCWNRTVTLLQDHADIHQLVVPGISEITGVSVPAPAGSSADAAALTQYGLKVKRGRALVRDIYILPVIEGKTSTHAFFAFRQSQLGDLLADPEPSRGRISDAVIVSGHPYYYHFLATHFPGLLLLRATNASPPTWVNAGGYPAGIDAVIKQFMASVAGAPSGRIVTLQPGVYDVENVVFAMRPHPALAPAIGRSIILPMILHQAGIAGPLANTIKIFVRRDVAPGRRKLLNQAEVESWFTARGYTPVNPGAMSFADQVMLFARASHIAGVEGGALTNLMFAVNARAVVMIASPATRPERFFQNMVADRAVPFHVLYGHCGGDTSADRNADYTLPLSALQTLGPC